MIHASWISGASDSVQNKMILSDAPEDLGIISVPGSEMCAIWRITSNTIRSKMFAKKKMCMRTLWHGRRIVLSIIV